MYLLRLATHRRSWGMEANKQRLKSKAEINSKSMSTHLKLTDDGWAPRMRGSSLYQIRNLLLLRGIRTFCVPQ